MNQKKIKKNLNRLYCALARSTDMDLAIMKIATDREFENRNKMHQIDNLINELLKDI